MGGRPHGLLLGASGGTPGLLSRCAGRAFGLARVGQGGLGLAQNSLALLHAVLGLASSFLCTGYGTLGIVGVLGTGAGGTLMVLCVLPGGGRLFASFALPADPFLGTFRQIRH